MLTLGALAHYDFNMAGEWTLAPAYDMTFAYNPNGAWTSQHQTTFNGKRRGFVAEDFASVGSAACLTKLKVRRAIEKVRAAVVRWNEFAEQAGVDEATSDQIGKVIAANASQL